MEFTVTNSAGDMSTMVATVTLLENSEYNSMAKIELSDYIVYTPKGTALNLMSYVQAVAVGGRTYEKNEAGVLAEKNASSTVSSNRDTPSMSDITTSGQVDYNTPGTYEVTYTYAKNSQNMGSVRLVVVVTE